MSEKVADIKITEKKEEEIKKEALFEENNKERKDSKDVDEVSNLLDQVNIKNGVSKTTDDKLFENDKKEQDEDEDEDEETEQIGEYQEDEEDEKAKIDLLHQLENRVEVKLADQQADLSSPLYSAKSFDELGLSPELLKGVYSMGYTKPSKIQERALPLLINQQSKNMIGQSQSGTGKTAAFVLTMLSKIDYSIDDVQAICLAPSRELARQIMDVAKEMGQFTKAEIGFAIRDENMKVKSPIKSHIVIGTPGTTKSLIEKRLLNTRHVKILVLDEADNMLELQGLKLHCSQVKRSLKNKLCQYVLFSATFPTEVIEFAETFAPNANEIRLKAVELSIDAIKQFYLDCNDNEERDSMLVDLYQLMTIGQSIIFVNSKRAADRIARTMTKNGYKVIALHGDLMSDERDRMIDLFRSGEAKVM
ncbi:DEAD-domain-containing protein [Neoconidiobolus thromboides FSU 785]|nr:DEAD-domain-containing protein [Neoconidiobolus thromboides FSU 785]